MKKKFVIYGIIILAVLMTGYFLFFSDENKTQKFSFTEISKGDLNVLISSTGTLEATSTVEVGTQVSGRIANLFVDFNDEVKKGQLLAILDTVTLAATVRDQQANLDRAKAQYTQSVAINERNIKLYEKKYISELDIIESKTSVESALATLKSAQSSLERANTNLSYAFIYAPIAGKIINRSVEQGQTVAASLSAPTLFTIAEDLSAMRILVNVDESDIGQIKLGQKVKFTVQAYSGKYFEGEVTQLRLNPNIVQNVVNYIVVVSADNKDRLLLPGMTATADFYVDYRENVLLIPNLALRFQPTDEMMEEYKKNMEKEMSELPDSLKNKFNERGGGGQFGGMNRGTNSGNSSGRRRNMNRVWYIDDKGNLSASPVFLGLSDGKNTEIVRGRNIKEGMKIITGIVESEAASTSSSNPLNPTQQSPQNMMRRGF
ncbi:MAG: efflux RND transporter periplasmic adaptor subunit [Ignavibacteriae bacterium HGW-Ignavibacteriae-2]|jgi:HlyD family secretion protein|nr:MAG: efflux RND transporter periplasmic adaptor subunit [Ignavibacteriae bacterium HGW-Ignavibacteriae-2]